jgi:AAA domain/Bifunctional DNA primase/polymerase, N-terminal
MTGPMTPGEAVDLAQGWGDIDTPAGPIALKWDHEAGRIAKRPLTRHGHHDFTTDPDEIQRRFAGVTLRAGEELGVGLWPGPRGWWVLDLDITDSADGRDTLHDLEQAGGDLPVHPIGTTPSGGEHRFLPKRPGTKVGNAHSFGPAIDVRGDDGWVVAPGTTCTWGAWEMTNDVAVPDHDEVPAWVYERLAATNGNGSHDTGRVGHWDQLDRGRLHPADLVALEALERLGGHDAYTANKGDKSYVMIARPGKTAAGVSIGYIGPGAAKVLHAGWWPLRQNVVYDGDWLTEIADAAEAGDRELAARLADPGYWSERLIFDPAEAAEAAAALGVTVVTLEEFAAVTEPGADALLGDGDDALIPANGDVMVYGDGGAGKTTLTVDLACHLAAGDNWLGITVPHPLTILVVENEGPRALFRKKLARKKAAWTGSALGGRVYVVENPWAQLSFADETHREALAKIVADHGCDIVLMGPVARSGMTDAGTLAEVRGFLTLVAEVRHRAGRAVTFVLVHHENKAGAVSGAWEGAGDTLLHVQGKGHGRTRLYVQKARWSSTWHAQTLELKWTDGEAFAVDEKPEVSDDDIAERILAAVAANPGTGWTAVAEAVTGIQRNRRTTIRDRLLSDQKIVNVAKENGHDVALDHCAQGRPAHLYLASDPTISKLRPNPGEVGAKSSPALDGAPNSDFAPSPERSKGEGWGEEAREPSPDLFSDS